MTRNNYQRKTTLIEGSHQKRDLWTQDFDRYERARVSWRQIQHTGTEDRETQTI